VAETPSNFVNDLAEHTDKVQQRHHAFAFTYAVIRKYNDDEAGLQAALLTYYGFLSLFPLLLIAISITDFLAQHNAHVRVRLLDDVTNYFPVVGEQLRQNIRGGHKTGFAFLAGLLVALYGTRGIVNAVRRTLDNAWAIPKQKRSHFPEGLLKGFVVLLIAGLGLLLTTVLAGYATTVFGHSLLFRLVPLAINAVLLYFICMFIFMFGSSREQPRQNVRLGAVTTVIGLFILQTVGGYLLTHELRRTSSLYGQFSLVLAIMFWMYLLAQVFTYAAEVNVVHTYRLWPRSLSGKLPTTADHKAQKLYPED
jgi:membrane protein